MVHPVWCSEQRGPVRAGAGPRWLFEEVVVRIGLRDDAGRDRCGPVKSTFSIPVGLDEDGGCGCACSDDPGTGGPGEPEQPVLPTLTLRKRGRTFYDEDRTPHWKWETVVTAPAILFESRSETNDATGQTKVTAKAVIGWSGGEAPKETSVAFDSRGRRWEVVSCEAFPGRLQLSLEWIDDAE